MSEKRVRGRPRSFDREAALDTAMLLFWRHGYEGTSIADLTNALGVTPPTLYAAFGSKEQLYREVLERYVARGELGRLREWGDQISAYEVLEQALRRVAESFSDPRTPPGCMVSSASLYCAAENESAKASASALRTSGITLLVAKLEQARASGELPEHTDPLALARFYGAVIQGMSVQAVDGASTAELQGIVDVALAAWPGKRPEPAPR